MVAVKKYRVIRKRDGGCVWFAMKSIFNIEMMSGIVHTKWDSFD